MTKRINVISHKDIYRLYKWIEENKTELEKLNRDQVTLKASKELSLVLTENNISAALDIVGVTTKPKRNETRGVYNNSNIGKNVLIAKALSDLYILTGNEPPDYLECLSSNLTMNEIIKTYNESVRNQA
jgi:hypothetical protein